MAYSPLPVKTSTSGPRILTAVGVLMLIAAVAVVVLVVRLFLSVLPTGIVAADGAPGADAAGGTAVPGTVTLALEADSTYVVYLAHPSGAAGVQLSDQVVVTGPTGQDATTAAAPSGSINVHGVSAHDVHAFHTGSAGKYTVTAPPLTDPDAAAWATIVVAPGDDMPSFFGGLFGSIAGVFLAIGLGVVGLIVTIVGAIWWYTRRKDRRSVASGRYGPPSLGGPAAPPGPPPSGGGPHSSPGARPGSWA